MDFIEYLDNTTLSPSTKKSYIYAYNKNDSGLFERSIDTTGEDHIISNIPILTSNPNTASLLITTCILIKRENNKPYNHLFKYRDHLKVFIEKHHNAKNSTISLPTYDDLIKYG